jgi:hypothetical protein
VLTVGGTLLNAQGGTIASLAGLNPASGSIAILNANIDNQGTLNVTGADLAINQGTGASANTLTNEANSTINVDTGRTLTVGGASVANNGCIEIGGTATVEPGCILDDLGVVTADAGGILDDQGTVTVGSGGTLTLGSTAWAALLADPGGVDVTGGVMLLDYNGGTDPSGQVQLVLATAYSHRFTSTSDLIYDTKATRSIGLGWVDNTATQQVKIRPALYGDANLNGAVDNSDLGQLLKYFNKAGGWAQGAFFYTGTVDNNDLGALLANFNKTLPLVAASVPMAGSSASASSAAPVTAVDTPAASTRSSTHNVVAIASPDGIASCHIAVPAASSGTEATVPAIASVGRAVVINQPAYLVRKSPSSGGTLQLTVVEPRALDRIDLSTLVDHELGSVAGLQDLDALTHDVMGGVPGAGVRRNASQVDAVLAS